MQGQQGNRPFGVELNSLSSKLPAQAPEMAMSWQRHSTDVRY
jgi:hypothetical protein